MRRIAAPYRIVDDEYIVSHPKDGHVLLMTSLVGWIWTRIDGDAERADVELVTAQVYSSIPETERTAMIDSILEMLAAEGLLDLS